MSLPIPNQSPWLHALERTRPLYHLDQPRGEDLVIIGGGIAGIMTAAFTLLRTNRSVLLLEATRIAHGATGHNAGQIVSYFERPLPDLVKQFGQAPVADAVRSIESAWDLLFTLRDTLTLKTPIFSFSGFLGLHEPSAIKAFLKTMELRERMHLSPQPLYVAREARHRLNLRAAQSARITWVSQATILDLLETTDPHFIAAQSERKGVTNSAVLCEEIAAALLARFPDRFFVIEETPVRQIDCGSTIQIHTESAHTIRAKDVVLCTNGFESFHLQAKKDPQLDRSFHATVRGTIGSMAGYIRPSLAPTAISYIERGYTKNPSYAYMTRRPHGQQTSLVCWGGPDREAEDTVTYRASDPVAQEHMRDIRAQIKHLHPQDQAKPFLFRWHGLMGYTKNGIRLIGPDPETPHLFYNLGCNGIGILPSIYGGSRLADLFSGKHLAPCLFDPPRSGKKR